MPDDLLGVVLSDLNGTRRAEIGACPGLAAQPGRPARSSAATGRFEGCQRQSSANGCLEATVTALSSCLPRLFSPMALLRCRLCWSWRPCTGGRRDKHPRKVCCRHVCAYVRGAGLDSVSVLLCPALCAGELGSMADGRRVVHAKVPLEFLVRRLGRDRERDGGGGGGGGGGSRLESMQVLSASQHKHAL